MYGKAGYVFWKEADPHIASSETCSLMDEKSSDDSISMPPPPSAKRFSVPRQISDRRVTIRPYESFREKSNIRKEDFAFGYASLNADDRDSESGSVSPALSVFTIYGDDPGPSAICEQPVGTQADIFIATLSDRLKHQLKKFLDQTTPMENQYFVWIKDHTNSKITVMSIKTLENHLKSTKRVRRVKWRHLSSDRISVYRYSIPSITYQKSKACTNCIAQNKKFCLLIIWLAFVLFLCVIVVLASLNPEERTHPFLHLHNLTNHEVLSVT